MNRPQSLGAIGLTRICILLLVLTNAAFASDNIHRLREQGIPSPDKKLIAYTTPALKDGNGSILYIRTDQPNAPATPLLENNRWIDASWSPNSKYLVATYGLDGHITDIYIFGFTVDAHGAVKADLYYRTPNPETYDTQWTFRRWKSDTEISLIREVRYTPEVISGHISSTPLKLDFDPQGTHFPKP
jgi:hypothetical protein